MNPVIADGLAAAMLEGFRRAMADNPVPTASPPGEASLTDVIESATEHAQGLAPRQPGTGERIDRTV